MVDYTDQLAVIGAGPTGLAIAKAFLSQGIPYEQFEAGADLGGNWRHGVYQTAHIISSKRTTQYPDFPMPDEYPDFPSQRQMLDYLRAYAERFQLRSQIQFNMKVVMAFPLENGQWRVDLENGEKRVYKGVVVCSGHHWDKRFPTYPGVFTNEFLHSKDYKCASQLSGKRVLVIGGGNSACDIASEAARIGRSSHISLRRGYWFLPKTIFGVPISEFIPRWMPVSMQRILLQGLLRIVVGRYERYGLPKPDHQIFEKHPTINAELLHYLRHGRIQTHPDVVRFEGGVVHFADGGAEEFDLVICATGFHLRFPFLPAGLVPVEGSVAQVYGGCVLPNYKNIYIIGTSQPRYGFGPLITPMADIVCLMIRLQERMELPIGLVLRESGESLPTTHLVDPHAALRQLRRAKIFMPLLLRVEQKLRKRWKDIPCLPHLIPAISSPDEMKVY